MSGEAAHDQNGFSFQQRSHKHRQVTVVLDKVLNHPRRPVSEHNRSVRKLVRPRYVAWKMRLQVTRNPLDSVKHAVLETADPERSLHLTADILPALAADFRMNAAVGDDLDVTVGKQQVNEHAVVVFGVPDSQRRKHFDGTLAR